MIRKKQLTSIQSLSPVSAVYEDGKHLHIHDVTVYHAYR